MLGRLGDAKMTEVSSRQSKLTNLMAPARRNFALNSQFGQGKASQLREERPSDLRSCVESPIQDRRFSRQFAVGERRRKQQNVQKNADFGEAICRLLALLPGITSISFHAGTTAMERSRPFSKPCTEACQDPWAMAGH